MGSSIPLQFCLAIWISLAGDGKQWLDNWKTAFDNGLKSAPTSTTTLWCPSAKDDLEKKKDAVIEAQNDLNFPKKIYDLSQKTLSNSGASSTNISKYI